MSRYKSIFCAVLFIFCFIGSSIAIAESSSPFSQCSYQKTVIVIQHHEGEATLSTTFSHEECGEDSPFIPQNELGIAALDFSLRHKMDCFSWMPPGLSVETPPPKA